MTEPHKIQLFIADNRDRERRRHSPRRDQGARTSHRFVEGAMSIIKAHADLIAKLAAIKPRPIPVFPDPDDFRERIAHMREIALAVDTYILALGRECQENVRGTFDISLFTAPLSNVLEGNAIYELECIAEELADEMANEEVA